MEFEVSLALAFLIIGILILVAEVASPGAFLVIPGTVLIILGGIGLVYPEWLTSWWSPIAAVIITVPLTYATIKMYQKLAPPAPPETMVATSLIGKIGIVEVEIWPNSIKGKVKIENDHWSATSDKVIPVGSMVVVKTSEGVHVKVEEVS
ncbi:MAG TPA: NfeD family protein [Thermoplasmata archaeon]|jgi:membrane protein implicated in regulation of membrane protease activity